MSGKQEKWKKMFFLNHIKEDLDRKKQQNSMEQTTKFLLNNKLKTFAYVYILMIIILNKSIHFVDPHFKGSCQK